MASCIAFFLYISIHRSPYLFPKVNDGMEFFPHLKSHTYIQDMLSVTFYFCPILKSLSSWKRRTFFLVLISIISYLPGSENVKASVWYWPAPDLLLWHYIARIRCDYYMNNMKRNSCWKSQCSLLVPTRTDWCFLHSSWKPHYMDSHVSGHGAFTPALGMKPSLTEQTPYSIYNILYIIILLQNLHVISTCIVIKQITSWEVYAFMLF